MKIRFRPLWLAFPAAALTGAVLCMLQSPVETTTRPATEKPSSPATTIPGTRTLPASASNAAPVSETDVTQALGGALLYSSGLHRRYELARIAEQVGEDKLSLLLQRYLEQPGASRADKLLLAELWAERAPEAAAAFVTKHAETYVLSQAVARGWARRDPRAAVAWVMGLPAERRLQLIADVQEGSFESAAPNPVEVMQAALQSYDAANMVARGEDITRLFTQWARQDASAAEAFARGLSDESQRQQGLLAIVSAVAETAPQRAIDLFEKIPMTLQWRTGPAANLAAQLAAYDLELATRFGQSQPEGQARASAIAAIARVILEQNPEKARALIESIPIADSFASAFSFYQDWIKSDPAAAFAHYAQRFEKIDPDNEIYTEARRRLDANLTNDSPVRETAEFLSGQTNASRQSRLTAVLERWMRQDSTGAAAWADALPSGSTREYALAGVAKGKAAQSITETTEWLTKLPKGPDYSAAVQGFASAVFSKDPDGALAWLKTIPNPAERQRRMLNAWTDWARSYSPADNRLAAQQWRDSSPDLTSDERKALVLP